MTILVFIKIEAIQFKQKETIMYKLLKKEKEGIVIIKDDNPIGKVQKLNLFIWLNNEGETKLKLIYNRFDEEPIILTEDQIEIDISFNSGYRIYSYAWKGETQKNPFMVKINFLDRKLLAVQKLSYTCENTKRESELILNIKLFR